MKASLIPWEVIERIIEQSGDDHATPVSFSLTCRQLRPCSLRIMVGRHVTLKSRNDTLAFVDCLRVNPHLKNYLQSIVVHPNDFSSFSRPDTFPNLRTIEFTSPKPIPTLVKASLTAFQKYAIHFQTLRLIDLSFPTPLVLDRILLAFAHVRHIVCKNVRVITVGDTHTPLEVIRRRLSGRLLLRTLTIDSESLTGGDDDTSVHLGALLFDPDLATLKIENLILIGVPRSDAFSHRPDWIELRSLKVHFPSEPTFIIDVVKLLDDFYGHSPKLDELSLELDIGMSLRDVTLGLSPGSGSASGVYTRLEQSLLRFTSTHPRIIWILKEPLHLDKHVLWARELGKRFPVLSGFGAFMLKFRIDGAWRTFTVKGEPVVLHDRPESPRLPWEVIERIILHASTHPDMLRNLSLTCRQLRPCALCLMIGRVNLKSGDQIFALREFLLGNPRLAPLVRSIVVDPMVFAAFRLLPLLRNLSDIEFTSRQAVLELHQFTVAFLRMHGTGISTLRLFHLSFPMHTQFLDILLVLPAVRNLVCTEVLVKKNSHALGSTIDRLRRLPELRTVTIDSYSLTGGDSNAPAHVGMALFHPKFASVMENLTLLGVPKPETFSHQPDWVRLRSLTFEFPFGTEYIFDSVTKVLEHFSPTKLAEVLLKFDVLSIPDVSRDLSRREPAECQELEVALSRFRRPAIVWMIAHPLRAERNSFWAQELGKYFPVLFGRGALTLKPSSIVFSAGHDGSLRALIISPNGRWLASASDDSTIILWDTDGTINQRWATHGYQSVWSLAFSPDSRYLASGGVNGMAAIWDLSQDLRELVTVLEGHTSTVSSCAWSPDGGSIASGSLDGTVRLWDAHTFQQLHLFKPGSTEAHYVTFSPNGHWLTSEFSPGDSCVWSVASGRLRTFIHNQLPDKWAPRASSGGAAFCPRSAHIATTTGFSGAVEIWHIETGERLFTLRQAGRATDFSFSPDGKSVVVGSEEGILTIWEVHTGAVLFVLKGHRQKISKALFSPSGRYILSASEDRTARLWRSSDGSCVAMFSDSEHEFSMTHAVFSSDGKTLWSGADDGTVTNRPILPLDECIRYYLSSSVL